MSDLIKEINELRNKAIKYEHMQTRLDGYNEKIEQAIKILQDVQKELNPLAYISTSYNSRYDYTDILEKGFNRMKMGLFVSRTWLEQEGLEENNIQVALKKFKEMSGVAHRHDGRTLNLFLKKEY